MSKYESLVDLPSIITRHWAATLVFLNTARQLVEKTQENGILLVLGHRSEAPVARSTYAFPTTLVEEHACQSLICPLIAIGSRGRYLLLLGINHEVGQSPWDTERIGVLSDEASDLAI
jgi:hypothetical protein